VAADDPKTEPSTPEGPDPRGLPPTAASAPPPGVQGPVTGPPPEPINVPTAGTETASSQTSPPKGQKKAPRWLLPVAVIVVVAIGLGVGLPLAFGKTSSTTTPPRSSNSGSASMAGGYYSKTVVDSRLVYLKLKTSAGGFTGTLTVSSAGIAKKVVVNKHYKVSVTASGSNMTFTVTPAVDGQTTLTGTYASNAITVTIAPGESVVLQRGKYGAYRALVTKESSTLLG
jgi:hypothetical protein